MIMPMLNTERWERVERLLPDQKTGRPAFDNRNFLDSVCWILQTGAPWRDLPLTYGNWKTSYNRYNRWLKRGYLSEILPILLEDKPQPQEITTE